jgi:hypothetical protein
MAATTITLDVLKGSIPAACFAADKAVSAAIVMVDGLETLALTIDSIVEGDEDTDEVVFGYDDSVVPSGVDLTECNFASFQCVCDSCEEKRCFEIIGPGADVETGDIHVAFLPGEMLVDQLRFYSPAPADDPLEVTIKFNGFSVATVEITDSGFLLDRTNFQPEFQDGVFEEDGEFTLSVLTAPTGDDAWQGLSLCLLGRWLS